MNQFKILALNTATHPLARSGHRKGLSSLRDAPFAQRLVEKYGFEPSFFR